MFCSFFASCHFLPSSSVTSVCVLSSLQRFCCPLVVAKCCSLWTVWLRIINFRHSWKIAVVMAFYFQRSSTSAWRRQQVWPGGEEETHAQEELMGRESSFYFFPVVRVLHCRTAASLHRIHTFHTHMRLIGVICVIVTWSQKGKLNCGPAVHVVCILNCILFCSYYVAIISLIDLNSCSLHSFTLAEQFVHQLINTFSFLFIQSVAPSLALFLMQPTIRQF